MKKITIIFGILFLAITAFALFSNEREPGALSYEECVAAGYEADDYECVTPEGDTFFADFEVPEIPAEVVFSDLPEPVTRCLEQRHGQNYVASARTGIEAFNMVNRCMEEYLNETFPDGPPEEGTPEA